MDLFAQLNEIGFPKLNLLDKPTFLRNMVFMHSLMLASEDLLEEAIKYANGDLLDYYKDHIEEERGHAEWLANDLYQIGVQVGEPHYLAAACAGTQYYLIRHIHPIALLGYMAVLEGYPMPMEWVERLEIEYGIEPLRTLRYHAEHDVDHRKDL
ncbi:MAG TPA: hypothetical protein VIY48_04175, partial [Candidatus Paceibacterota bacterium]